MCQTASHFHRKSEAVCCFGNKCYGKEYRYNLCLHIIYLCIRWRKKNEKQMLEYAFHWFDRLIER